jgi:cytosine/adenosine deaminase-related metal-dependent hydrolase
MMHLFQADYVFPVTSGPVKNGIVRLNKQGIVLEVINPENSINVPESSAVQKFRGVLCPGFINIHFHLELSHLKNKKAVKAGMTGFLGGMLANRNKFSADEISGAIDLAEKEMIANGIVAVGDISNTSDSFLQKSTNNLHYHTFIEVYDLGSYKAEETFLRGKKLQEKLNEVMPEGHSSSLVPHAPYTCSPELLSMLSSYCYENDSLITIHNQESAAENNLFISNAGPLYDFFIRAGIDLHYISKKGFNSLQSSLIHLSDRNKTLLVHNTFTSEEDVARAVNYSKLIYWCFCVNANLFIENTIPQIKNFLSQTNRPVLGTDSLASNHQLSVLEEMKTISSLYPSVSFNEMLKWATINGADFFNIKNNYGSFEPGKKPGINLIENVNTDSMSLTPSATVRRLF